MAGIWTQHTSPDGRVFFFNMKTMQSRWDHPDIRSSAPATTNAMGVATGYGDATKLALPTTSFSASGLPVAAITTAKLSSAAAAAVAAAAVKPSSSIEVNKLVEEAKQSIQRNAGTQKVQLKLKVAAPTATKPVQVAAGVAGAFQQSADESESDDDPQAGTAAPGQPDPKRVRRHFTRPEEGLQATYLKVVNSLTGDGEMGSKWLVR